MAWLKRVCRWLNTDLTGRTWTERADHDYFGSMTLFAFRDSPTSYWEAQLVIDNRTVDVFIESPERTPPCAEQVRFAQALAGAPPMVRRRVAPQLAEAFAQFYKEPMPAEPDDWLALVSFSIPARGQGAYELHFESVYDGRHVLFQADVDATGVVTAVAAQ